MHVAGKRQEKKKVKSAQTCNILLLLPLLIRSFIVHCLLSFDPLDMEFSFCFFSHFESLEQKKLQQDEAKEREKREQGVPHDADRRS